MSCRTICGNDPQEHQGGRLSHSQLSRTWKWRCLHSRVWLLRSPHVSHFNTEVGLISCKILCGLELVAPQPCNSDVAARMDDTTLPPLWWPWYFMFPVILQMEDLRNQVSVTKLKWLNSSYATFATHAACFSAATLWPCFARIRHENRLNLLQVLYMKS